MLAVTLGFPASVSYRQQPAQLIPEISVLSPGFVTSCRTCPFPCPPHDLETLCLKFLQLLKTKIMIVHLGAGEARALLKSQSKVGLAV